MWKIIVSYFHECIFKEIVGCGVTGSNQTTRRSGKTYSTEEKKTVLDSLKDKSKQEVEKILVSLSPSSAVGSEKAKPVTDTLTELKIWELRTIQP